MLFSLPIIAIIYYGFTLLLARIVESTICYGKGGFYDCIDSPYGIVGLYVFSFIIFVLILSLLYISRQLVGAKNVIKIKNSNQSVFETSIISTEIKKIVYTYDLKAPAKTWRELLGWEINPELENEIKKIYPDFKFVPEWKLGAGAENFTQVLEILERVDKDTIVNMKLFSESLRLTIINNDTKEKYSVFLEPSYGMFFFRKSLTTINRNEVSEKLFQGGKSFTVRIEYNGVKCYNFRMWVK